MSLISEHLYLLKMCNITLSHFDISNLWYFNKNDAREYFVGSWQRQDGSRSWNGCLYAAFEIIALRLLNARVFLIPRLCAALSCSLVPFPCFLVSCSAPCWYSRNSCWTESLPCFEEIWLKDNEDKLKSHGAGNGKAYCKDGLINELMNLEKIES